MNLGIINLVGQLRANRFQVPKNAAWGVPRNTVSLCPQPLPQLPEKKGQGGTDPCSVNQVNGYNLGNPSVVHFWRG
ncbi:MAG: hypothetical protein AB1861_06505 [Cyanobacteriota bacterium]